MAACQFGAISINPETGIPEVDEEKCTGCGACANACPRHIIELRKKGPKSRRVYVQCVNHDKGAVAKKACSVACIGCGKCQKVCKFDAITIENNVAYVDFNKCRMCTKGFTPNATGISSVNAAEVAAPAVKKMMTKDGLVIVKGNKTFSLSGAQMK